MFAAFLLHGLDVHFFGVHPQATGVLQLLLVARSLVYLDVPPASVFPVLGLLFLPDRYGTVTKYERPSTFLLAVIEPHVHIAVERAGGGHFEFRSPAHPVDRVLMGVPLVQHLDVTFRKDDIFSVFLSSSAGNEGVVGGFVDGSLAHLLLLGLKGLLHVFLGRVEHLLLLKFVQERSYIPSLHVTELITSPDDPFLGVVIDGSDGEVSVFRRLRLGQADLLSLSVNSLSVLMRDLLLSVELSLSAEEGALNITRRNSVEVEVAFNISRDYAVGVLDKLADKHTGRVGVIGQ